MHFYNFLNVIVFFFLLEIIIHSSADDWKKLKKKLIALSILNGMRVKKSYVVPFPLPLPMPVIIKKASHPIILPPKKYPVLVPKPMPVYHLVPKFVPVHHKHNVIVVQEPQEVNFDHSQRMMNHGWDQDWSPDAFSASENIPVNQDLLSLQNDAHQVLDNKFGFPFNHGLQDYQDQSLAQHMVPEADMGGRKNKNRFEKQGFRSFQDIGFNDYHNNEDLLMSSTELKSKKASDKIPKKGIRQMKTANKSRELYREVNPKIFPAPKKLVDRLPVTEDEIKHILTDWKTINDEVKLLPNGQISISNTPTKTSIKRVQVGEIRIRPQQLRSLLSNSKISFETK